MSFRAIAFAVALVMLVAGIIGSGPVVNILGRVDGHHTLSTAARRPRSTALPQSQPPRRPRSFPVRPTPVARRTPLPASPPSVLGATASGTHSRAHQMPARPHEIARRPEPAPGSAYIPPPNSSVAGGSVPFPTTVPAVPTTSTVRLINYWLASVHARRGQTVSLVYVFNNATGAPVRLWLGASLKRPAVPEWGAGAINDPAHDTIALVPPGVSVYTRYFTLTASLRPGAYDVAWSVRDPDTGQRIALVAADKAL